MDAAVKARIPVVVAPGCLDMVNFGEKASVPAKFSNRTFYIHNPQVTLMRTTPAECAELGAILAKKVNAYTVPSAVMIPRKAISVISAPGKAFHDALRQGSKVPVHEFDCEINDPVFATACANKLIELMRGQKS
jgi:uncharacterized protein (UPF0261 family)